MIYSGGGIPADSTGSTVATIGVIIIIAGVVIYFLVKGRPKEPKRKIKYQELRLLFLEEYKKIRKLLGPGLFIEQQSNAVATISLFEAYNKYKRRNKNANRKR